MFMWHDYSKMILKNIENDLDNGIVKLKKLSDSLDHLSHEGFNDFYVGDIAKEILKTVANEGGHATSEDFSNYTIIEDSKFNFKYKNLMLTGHVESEKQFKKLHFASVLLYLLSMVSIGSIFIVYYSRLFSL